MRAYLQGHPMWAHTLTPKEWSTLHNRFTQASAKTSLTNMWTIRHKNRSAAKNCLIYCRGFWSSKKIWKSRKLIWVSSVTSIWLTLLEFWIHKAKAPFRSLILAMDFRPCKFHRHSQSCKPFCVDSIKMGTECSATPNFVKLSSQLIISMHLYLRRKLHKWAFKTFNFVQRQSTNTEMFGHSTCEMRWWLIKCVQTHLKS